MQPFHLQFQLLFLLKWIALGSQSLVLSIMLREVESSRYSVLLQVNTVALWRGRELTMEVSSYLYKHVLKPFMIIYIAKLIKLNFIPWKHHFRVSLKPCLNHFSSQYCIRTLGHMLIFKNSFLPSCCRNSQLHFRPMVVISLKCTSHCQIDVTQFHEARLSLIVWESVLSGSQDTWLHLFSCIITLIFPNSSNKCFCGWCPSSHWRRIWVSIWAHWANDHKIWISTNWGGWAAVLLQTKQ